MKRTLRFLAVTALALCLSCAAAFAAAPVDLMLDGDAVEFTDATPQIVNGRTYLPFRSVFESLDAEVDFADGVITAKRDGKTITMTIGSTEATVAADGKTETIAMDAAPFIENERTYVPVRFAAQALGANVGWDEEKRTVVILDTEKLLDSALEGKTFRNLERVAAFGERYNEGIWNSELALDGTLDVDLTQMDPEAGRFSFPMTATAKGVTEGTDALEVTEDIVFDLSALKEVALASLADEDLTEEERAAVDAMLDTFSKQDLKCAVRGDMKTGKLYLNLDLSSLSILATAGVETPAADSDTWYLLDIKALYDELGIDLDSLLAQSREFDLREICSVLLSGADVNTAAFDYDALSDTVRELAAALSDDAFRQNGNVSTAEYRKEIDGLLISADVVLTTEKDAVKSYTVRFGADGELEDVGPVKLAFELTVDEKDQVSGKLDLAMADATFCNLEISGGYVKGDVAPATEPPAGAKIVDLKDYLNTIPMLPEE